MSQLKIENKVFRYKVENAIGINIDAYDEMLSPFEEWKKFKREIIITNILEGKSVEYKIENILTSSKRILGYLSNDNITITNLKQACFIIKSMIFVIKDKTVKDLSIEVDILYNHCGELISWAIQNEIEIKVEQTYSNEMVLSFLVDFDWSLLPKSSA